MYSAARVTKPPKPVPPVVGPPETAFGRPLRRFTVPEYHKMIDAGVFVGGPKTELIHGCVLEKPVPNPPHSFVTAELARLLSSLFTYPDYAVRVQDPITLSSSEPQPDLAAAIGPPRRYVARHPGPKDLVLVVEVSDSSTRIDRSTKLALYAGEKVVQYWIVDVNDRVVEVYTRPRGGRSPGYKAKAEYRPAAGRAGGRRRRLAGHRAGRRPAAVTA